MNISDEAVEAAAKVMLDKMYDDKTLRVDDEDRAIMRSALEAAAPYTLAPLVADLDKWAGRSRTGFYDEAQDDVVQILNPYRSQS